MGQSRLWATDDQDDRGALGMGQAHGEASGLRPAQLRQAELRGRRRRLLLRLRAARDELGRWPGSREWERATADHASSRTYARNFHSWEAARRAAARLNIKSVMDLRD
ncbi:MAG: hypothetical protein M3072_04505 [Candidatus Dormibacteraeota bacterium]|nr:hypothetical protein [Candidatus Dormibacteraeota bacterium]